MIEKIKKDLVNFRRKKIRIRSIFLNLRKLNKFWGLSDLVLLNCIVIGLRELGGAYSKNEIYSAFKMVDRNDYEKENKRCLLKFLLEKAKDKSVF